MRRLLITKRRCKSIPGYAEAHNNLGSALLIKGNVEEAIAQYQKALQLKPQNVHTLNSLAWVMATCPRLRCATATRR